MSDIKRLKAELTVIWQSLLDELQESSPQLSRRERETQARSQLLARVDEVIQEVTGR